MIKTIIICGLLLLFVLALLLCYCALIVASEYDDAVEELEESTRREWSGNEEDRNDA